jgi:type I restriction enzyme M protein
MTIRRKDTMNTKTLDLPTLEPWLWDTAYSIRGDIDAPKNKEYVLPLPFYKRLPDVYADEIARIAREIGDADLARELSAQDRSLIRVTVPGAYTCDAVRRDPTGLGDLGLRDGEPDL